MTPANKLTKPIAQTMKGRVLTFITTGNKKVISSYCNLGVSMIIKTRVNFSKDIFNYKEINKYSFALSVTKQVSVYTNKNSWLFYCKPGIGK